MQFLFLIIFPILAYASPSLVALNGQCERVAFGSVSQQRPFASFFENLHKGKKEKQFRVLVTELFANREDEKQVLRYLIRQGHINSPLLSAVIHRSPSKAINLLKEQPGLLNGPAGKTAFFMMIRLGLKKATLLALEIWPELARFKTSENERPLSYVTDPEIAEALLSYGAPINTWDKKGRTAIYYAPNREVAEVLVQHGADLVIKDYSGLNPLEYHRQFVRDDKIITLLEEKQSESRIQRRNKKNHSPQALKRAQTAIELRQQEESNRAERRAKILEQSEAERKRIEGAREDRRNTRRENRPRKAEQRRQERLRNRLLVVQEQRTKLLESIEHIDRQIKIVEDPTSEAYIHFLNVFTSDPTIRKMMTTMGPTEFAKFMEGINKDLANKLATQKENLQNNLQILEQREEELLSDLHSVD